MPLKVAAITMIYNEPEYLPIWLKYYSSQLGYQNCFVLDHGSDDDCTRDISCGGVFHLPRTPQDENKRVDTISNIVNSLLNYYDVVIYSDVDEIIVPNPSVFGGIADFCASMSDPVITAVGLNVHHLVDVEPELDLSKPILLQRHWVRFVSPMCKPIITRVPIRWGRGFHSSNHPLVFGDIYLFHLRYFDLKIGLDRLNRTRVLTRASEGDIRAAQHQRIADEEYEGMMRSVSKMSKEMKPLSVSEVPLKPYLDQCVDDMGKVNLNTFANVLWPIPVEFSEVF